ncbi:MAG: hypothetical protein NC453_13330 [Muribaculum sp.]|nr:hypothetical protein [Muribaculum sp.]
MRRKLRKFLVIIGALLCLFLVVLIVALHSMRLEKIGYREGEYKLTDTQIKIIKSECAGNTNIEDLIDKCGEIVCSQLTFKYRNDLNNGQANCVGYARFHSAVLNHAFKINHLPYKARPVYGKTFLWGMDLHPLFKSIIPKKFEPFFNNHDYTEIDLGEEYIYTDTSIEDLFSYRYSRKQ